MSTYAAKNEITGIQSRPNVIMDFDEGRREEAMRLSDMLTSNEINVSPHIRGEKLDDSCLFGKVHMMILRDGGLSAPAFGTI